MSATKPLSCTHCRTRKVRCNRIEPCDQCLKAELECAFPTRRVRAARSFRPRGPDTRDAELLRRVKRLESLLSRQNSEKALAGSSAEIALPNPGGADTVLTPSVFNSNDADATPQASAHGGAYRPLKDSRLDEHYASFIKRQSLKPGHLSGEFWSTLGDEFQGLRKLLERTPESIDEEDDELLAEEAQSKASSPSFILHDLDPSIDIGASHPSDEQRAALFDVYYSYVDPMCKMLHRPTSKTFLSGAEDLVDPASGRVKFPSLEACMFAIYFMAVTSISEAECETRLGEAKDILVARYKRCTEIALTNADFMNSIELVTLQGLTLYILAMLSNKMTGTCWALIGLAVRIAHGLGFHRDEGGGYTLFDAEMRRRLWWQILELEMMASEHRGSRPLILESSFNVKMPAHVNDSDFGHDLQTPLIGRNGITDSTVFIMSIDGLNVSRKINWCPPLEGNGLSSLPQMEALVQAYHKRVETQYVVGCDQSIPEQAVVWKLSRWWVLRTWLMLQYPLQRSAKRQAQYPRVQGLRTALALIQIAEHLDEDPAAARFTWFSRIYAPWHTLAVALAELCRETQGPLVGQAWPSVENSYRRWSERIAATKEVEMWRPITSLLKRARAARQRARTLSDVETVREPSALASLLKDVETVKGNEAASTTFSGSSAAAEAPVPHTSDIHTNQQFNLGGSIAPADHGGPVTLNPMAMDFDVFDVDGLNAMLLDSNPAPMNWDDWNEFVYDLDPVAPEAFPSWS